MLMGPEFGWCRFRPGCKASPKSEWEMKMVGEDEYLSERIAKCVGIEQGKVVVAIEAALTGIGCMAKGPPPPGDCKVRAKGKLAKPMGLIELIEAEARISRAEAGAVLAELIAAITHIGNENGIHSVLEFRA